jgi:hypothetical protein
VTDTQTVKAKRRPKKPKFPNGARRVTVPLDTSLLARVDALKQTQNGRGEVVRCLLLRGLEGFSASPDKWHLPDKEKSGV